jgi:hypothetical protein
VALSYRRGIGREGQECGDETRLAVAAGCRSGWQWFWMFKETPRLQFSGSNRGSSVNKVLSLDPPDRAKTLLERTRRGTP